MKLLERRVNDLVEESCLASARGEFQLVCLSLCLSVSLFMSVCFTVCIFLSQLCNAAEIPGVVNPR